jgi:hypothetical protein
VTISQLANCSVLDISNNALTGDIPQELFSMVTLSDVNFGGNYLSSTLASDVGFLTLLQSLVLGNNLLTGTIVPELNGLFLLRTINLQSNRFSGTFPQSEMKYLDLQSFSVASNLISGSLSSDLSYLQRLQYLNVSYNLLTGPLDSLFESEYSLLDIVYFDVSLNAFSSSIPANLFQYSARHKLESVVLFSNCFSGSLGSELCDAQNLTTLILDSMSSNAQCSQQIPGDLRTVFNVFVGDHTMKGSIPDCLWSMPALTTAHLSGLGLVGTLADISPESALVDVSLASNALTGAIPVSWQQQLWQSLDLSNNKLSGTLFGGFTVGPNMTTLDLTVNRLSGDIPSSFQVAPGLNILDGNLFQCSDASKPQSDPNRDEYVCGSDDFNDSIIFWLSILAFFVALLVWKSRRFICETDYYYTAIVQKASQDGINSQNIIRFMELLRRNCLFKLIGLVSVILVPMMSYIGMKYGPDANVYSTHTAQYLWATTAAFLHGALPFVLVMLYLFAGIIFFCTFLCNVRYSMLMQQCRLIVESISFTKRAAVKCTRLSALMLLHVIVTLCVNIAYVAALISGVKSANLVILQIALSLFKLAWSNAFITWCLKRLSLPVIQRLLCSSVMLMFTFIASPVIATFFSDTTCFRFVITGQPAVRSEFSSNEFTCGIYCIGYNCANVCGFYADTVSEVSTSVIPSWQYSYQCSSSLLENYAPVLMFSYAFSGLVMPALRIFYGHLSAGTIDKVFGKTALRSFINSTVYVYDLDKKSLSDHKIFNAVQICSQLCLNAGILFTFGIANPLIVFAVAADSCALLIAYKFLINRFVRLHSFDSVRLAEAWRQLDYAAEGILAGIPGAAYSVVAFSGMFWAVFAFDMIGDVYGSTAGGLVIMVPVVGVSVAFISVAAINDWRKQSVNDAETAKTPTVSSAAQPTDEKEGQHSSNPIIVEHIDTNEHNESNRSVTSQRSLGSQVSIEMSNNV